MRLYEMTSVKQIDGNKLFWTYYNNGNGSDPTLFDRNKFLNPREMERETHFIIVSNGKVIADAAIEISPYDANEVWLKHVFVDEDFRNKGLSQKLIDAIFKFCLDSNRTLQRSSPTDMGAKYLPQVFDKLKQKYPSVSVKNSNS